MQNLFEYLDYRKYLADYYLDKKETTQFFSYRYFAQKTGVNSPSFLKTVIEGKRNLTPNMAERFAKALGFKAKEKAYFLNLVAFNQAKTFNEKQLCYAIFRSLSKRVKESVIKGDQYDLFSNWYVPAIRELICIRNFNDDFDALAAALEPSIDSSRAKAAVELLLRLKLVEKTKDGIYKQTSAALSADDSITSLAVRAFTHSMIGHSRNSLETISKENRHISGITMGISRKSYDMITNEIEAFKERLKIIVAHDDAANSVYQINLALFPISKIQENGGLDCEPING
jgi:uncharacterized protein (TIGR02147 family)